MNSALWSASMANELSCGWSLEKFSLLYDYYAYFDTKDYLADNLFIKHKVTVHFMQEYAHDGTEYIVILCKCRKRDSAAFCAALQELPKKMLICGHRDYMEFCKEIKAKAEEGRKQMRREGGLDHGTTDTAGQAKQESAKGIS